MTGHGRIVRGISLTACVAALMTTAPASAQEPGPVVTLGPNPQWESLGVDDGSEGFIDRANVRVEGGAVRFVGRMRYEVPEDEVAEVVFTGEIQCTGNTYRTVAFDLLDAAGSLLESHVVTVAEGPAVPINEGSHNADMRARYCP